VTSISLGTAFLKPDNYVHGEHELTAPYAVVVWLGAERKFVSKLGTDAYQIGKPTGIPAIQLSWVAANPVR
jgi:hypothetical protein